MEELSLNEGFTYADFENKMQIEAALFLTPEGLTAEEISKKMPNIPLDRAFLILKALVEDYTIYEGGLRVISDDGNKFRFDIAHSVEFEPEVQKFFAGNEFTPSEIKVLAFIGYNQPVEYQDIVDFLGSSVRKTIKALLEQNLVGIIEKKRKNQDKAEKNSGTIQEYRTTKKFAQILGVENKPELIKTQIQSSMN